MKAARMHGYGPSDDLSIEVAPKPTINAQEILVKVCSAGVNYIDYLKASGT